MPVTHSIIAIAAVTALSPAMAQTHPMIASGPTEDHPAVVGLGIDLGEQRYVACTGTLITPQLVLTAAHCGNGLELDVVVDTAQVYFGRSDTDIDEIIGLSDAWIHPDSSGLDFDLGLVALAQDATVTPTAMWSETIDSEFVGSTVTAVGWGLSDSGPESSGIKRAAPLTIDRVSEMFLISFQDTNAEGALPCDGDSGGPLYREVSGQWVQVGVHSWGEDPCGDRAGSTRIDIGKEWISTVIEEVHGTEDICEINDKYGDGVCDRDCPAPDSDCEKSTACGCSAAGKGPLELWLALPLLWVRTRR